MNILILHFIDIPFNILFNLRFFYHLSKQNLIMLIQGKQGEFRLKINVLNTPSYSQEFEETIINGERNNVNHDVYIPSYKNILPMSRITFLSVSIFAHVTFERKIQKICQSVKLMDLMKVILCNLIFRIKRVFELFWFETHIREI